MKSHIILAVGSILMAITVGFGAFGAHALKDLLEQTNRIATFETAVKYQAYHSLAILLLGVLAALWPNLPLKGIFWLFLIGIIIFSGSLYILCLTGKTWLGAITPLGGVSLIAAWVWLAVKLIKLS